MNKIDFSQQSILIIDDQKPFLALLRSVLNSAGATSDGVVSAKSGEAALVICRKQQFDFIICDLHFGSNKKNGFQLLEELREKALMKPSTVFVLVSADSQRPVVLGSLEKQPDEYVVKPFSQAQLVLRLEKAYVRKLALAPIYKHIYAKNFKSAIAVCKQVIEADNRYKELVGRMLTELYWHTEQYQEAQKWLNSYNEDNKRTWLGVSKAQTALLLKNYTGAIELANLALARNNLLIEAHDIIAQSQFELGNFAEAENAINTALKLSPYSIPRLFKACVYARKNGNHEKIIGLTKSIWEHSKRSVYRDMRFLCAHVRSYLDMAEHEKEPKAKGRLQQEALYTLQRYRHSENIIKQDEFDFDTFEGLINARIHCQNGKLLNSKQAFVEAQQKIEQKFEDFPLSMAPDGIASLLDLGEFDDAQTLMAQIAISDKTPDDNTAALLREAQARSREQHELYVKHNQLGIAYYSEGKFAAAHKAFSEAQKSAPVNIGIILNLLQCSVRLLQNKTKPGADLLTSTRKIFRQLQNMPMLDKHQQKFALLRDELTKLIDLR